MSIKEKAAKGMMWNTIERFSTQGIQFVLTIIIARILSPDDYGLVAMLGIFLALAQTLVDSGFSNALIQKKSRTEIDYYTTFYFNIVISVCIYGLFYLFAPLIANFYHQPELVKISRILGLTIIINSLSVVQMARFTIALDFRKLALVSLSSVVGGGSVGLYMAFHGYGVWALVCQSLATSICWVVSLWLKSDWRPRWAFSLQSFCTLFSFGSKIMLSGLIHTFYVNMYSLVVGKVFSASVLGYFNRAYTLGQFPVQNFSNIFQKVLYPILCRYQDDETKFNYVYTNYLRMACFLLFPLMVGFAVLAKPLVAIILTEKWLPAVPLLQVICLAQMWDPVMKVNVSVLGSKGHSDYQLYAEIIKKIVAFIILFVSVPFGIKAVCWGLLLYAFADMGIVIWYSRKLTGYGYWWQIKNLLPIALIAFTMGGGVWMVSTCFLSWWSQLLSGILVGVISYIMLGYVFRISEFRLFLLFLKNKAPIV